MTEAMHKLLFVVLLCAGTTLGAPAMSNGDVLDGQMAEVAAFFAGRISGDDDVLLATELDRSKLDLSVESLIAVDRWLTVLREADVDPASNAYATSVILAGAYVGEVIRACASGHTRGSATTTLWRVNRISSAQ